MHSGGETVSRFARKALGARLQPCQREEFANNDGYREFTRTLLDKSPATAQAQEPARTITLPRLWVWVPARSADDIKAGRAGWLPAAIAGTAWDAQQWRTQYKARHMCTLWIKAGLENAT